MSLKDIRPALRAALLADSAVSSAVGGSRVYPMRLPQGQQNPSIVYNRIGGGAGDYSYSGRVDPVSSLIQVDCWARTPDLAQSLAAKVRERLDGFSGVVMYGDNSPPSDSISIQGIFVDRVSEDYDSEAELYRESVDYRVTWVMGDSA